MSKEVIVAISALEHFEYCERQCALIHVDGVWVDNEHTERGHAGHRRVDNDRSRVERGRTVLRGIPLWSESLGLTGRADAVEVSKDGEIAPVEYKIGTRHGRTADVQMCAQALCLEEMFSVSISCGYIWLSAHRRKQAIDLDEELRNYTIDVVRKVRKQMYASFLPPAVNDARCSQCQLYAHCLPGVVSSPHKVVSFVEQKVLTCN